MKGVECRLRAFLILPLLLLAAACAPRLVDTGPAAQSPALYETHFWTRDGIALSYRRWLAESMPPRAVIVALHGFNDYSAFFDKPAAFLKKKGIASYAYDQRGFGANGFRGRWFANDRLRMDALDFTRAVAAKHPGVPVYLLGESMGGAVAMTAATGPTPPAADGIILSAPAVWGRAAMSWYERLALWVAAHTFPGMTLTGRGLNITPSDNVEMLRALGRDPLVIKETRVETIHGLVGLMDAALAAAPRFQARALVLYGRKDEIIPGRPTFDMVRRLPGLAAARQSFALYKDGYHMLLRDLQAETVWRDILAWIGDAAAPLPSGADGEARTVLAEKP